MLDFCSVFFRLAYLALQNVNKDYVTFSYFLNFIAKSHQKPKTKNGMNDANIYHLGQSSHNSLFGFLQWHKIGHMKALRHEAQQGCHYNRKGELFLLCHKIFLSLKIAKSKSIWLGMCDIWTLIFQQYEICNKWYKVCYGRAPGGEPIRFQMVMHKKATITIWYAYFSCLLS